MSSSLRPVQFKLGAAERSRLAQLAQELGVSRSGVVRILINRARFEPMAPGDAEARRERCRS